MRAAAHGGWGRLDRLNIGAVEMVAVSGVVSVGCAYIRRCRTTEKGTVGNCAIVGDYGLAPMGFGVVIDSDGIDAPVWWTAAGRGTA